MMSNAVDFEALIGTVGVKSGSDVSELKDELEKLENRKDQLQKELSETTDRMRQLKEQRSISVRKAVKAADQLGIEVPERYRKLANTYRGRSRSGKYEWKTEGLKRKKQSVSAAMWRLSKGSGGSAGSENTGILLSGEFWNLVREQTNKTEDDIGPGDELTVVLPNGRKIRFTKVQ